MLQYALETAPQRPCTFLIRTHDAFSSHLDFNITIIFDPDNDNDPGKDNSIRV
jgi:hypothetical protein